MFFTFGKGFSNYSYFQGQNQSGGGSGGDKKDDKDKKKKYEPPIPTRVGKKKRKAKGPDAALKLPQVTPHTRCRLKLLKLERIKDYLLMEEEFIRNQERLKPQEEKIEEERSKVPTYYTSLCEYRLINISGSFLCLEVIITFLKCTDILLQGEYDEILV